MSSFHYDFILSKRSSLAKVWLAAHWEKKLSKVQIFEANVNTIVQDILHPKTPMALRTSSHLLVGLVRIYSRKAKYLLKDCSDTLVNIKVAFRPGVSSLEKPAKQRKSAKEIMDNPLFITEKVDLLDQWVPEVSNVELDCTLNQSKMEEITLQEEPMKVSSLEEYFDDEGFGEMDAESTDITGKTLNSCTSFLERGSSFADSAYDDQVLIETTSLTDYYSDPFSSTLTPVKDFSENSPSKKTTDQHPKLLLDLDLDLRAEADGYCVTSSLEEREEATVTEDNLFVELDFDGNDETEENSQLSSLEDEILQDNPSSSQLDEEQSLKRSFEEQEDVVILDPVDMSQRKSNSSRKKLKRKLLIDEVICVDRQVMYENMNNPSPFLKTPDFAARTKRRMKQKERNRSLLSRRSAFELSPALDELFLGSKRRTLSTSSNVSSGAGSPKPASEQETSLAGFENNEDLFLNQCSRNDENHKPDELDLSEQFIPLQDVEYSSDEECPFGNSPPENMNEFDFALTREEETEEVIVDENISDDKFCSSVESAVLQSRPHPVSFRQIVGRDGGNLTRKTVARRFLKCLLMQRDARLSLAQEGSFQEVFLHPGLKHASEEA